MEFCDKVDGFSFWYNIFFDCMMIEFFQIVLGMLLQLLSLDIDKQVEMFEKCFSLEKLQDLCEVEVLILCYMIIWDVNNLLVQVISVVIQILNNLLGQFVLFMFDIDVVNFLGSVMFFC